MCNREETPIKLQVVPLEYEEGTSERTVKQTFAAIESAFATLDQEYVQNIFGPDAIDVVYDALNLYFHAWEEIAQKPS